jgi:isopropylmalate/homocitrate/citramalate synthase
MSHLKDVWISPYNFTEEVLGGIHLPEKVGIYDCTLRDGEQVPGLVFRKDEKISIAQALDELGVQRIEAGMPVVSPEDKEVATELMKLGLQAEIWGFCRCIKTDIDACIESGLNSVICEIATSDYKMKAYGLTRDSVKERMTDAITYAKEHGLKVAFFCVDMTRTGLEFLKEAYVTAVKEAHADEVVVVDTLGVALPEAVFYLTSKVKEWVKVPIQVHCHNELGLGTACSLAAVKAGAEWVHVTANGIGEKSGNTDLAEVAMTLLLLYNKDTGLKYEKLTEVSRLVQEASGIKMPPNKPIVGDSVFKRESGVAVLQLTRYPPAVEPYPPELVGGTREIIIGKKSGRHSIEWKLKELGISATEQQVAVILERVKRKSAQKKGLINDEEFKSIATDVV